MPEDTATSCRFAGQQLNHIAMPMGGLGAGCLCLTGCGGFLHVMWRHAPDWLNDKHPFSPHGQRMFAALSVKGGEARVLEGPLPDWRVFGPNQTGNGVLAGANGLPRCAEASFTNRFPFGEVQLRDEALPVDVTVTGWSPFIPGDADNSGLPVAGVEYTLTAAEDVDAVLSIHMQHPMRITTRDHATRFIAADAPQHDIRRIDNGIVFAQPGTPAHPEYEGAAALMVFDEADATYDACWFRGSFFDSDTLVWQDIAAARLVDRPPASDGYGAARGGSIYVPVKLAAGESRTVRFLLSWYVPYSTLFFNGQQGACCPGGACSPAASTCYRPWYASRFASIDAVATYWSRRYQQLRDDTQRFADSFFASGLPPEVIDAVSCNLSILKSPTILRQYDGRLWLYEGCFEAMGCCEGSCSHVWNYAQAICHLFPSLERTLRETEFTVTQRPDGGQNFRTMLPIQPAQEDSIMACDGQLGGVIKVFRDWRISGDTAWLRRLWPHVQQSLACCISTWDPGSRGVITEPHHNTYDIEFWGPDGMCMSFYLAALHAAVQMADALGEDSTAYADLRDKGKAYCEAELYDGEYYIQRIDWSLSTQSPLDPETSLVKGVYSPEARALLEREGPKYQYGTGCLSDGVMGEFMAWSAGLDPVLDSDRIHSHLRAVHHWNLKTDLSRHPNPQRPGFALGHEGGLLLCTWPKGGALSLPFIYSNEVWTGIEYQVAAHLISHGSVAEGLEIVRCARARYDGVRRNPYDEYECGHWYGRALSSYALLQALSGIRYDAVDRVLYLAPRLPGDFQCFFATHSGFGLAGMRAGKPFCDVAYGTIHIDRFELPTQGR